MVLKMLSDCNNMHAKISTIQDAFYTTH